MKFLHTSDWHLGKLFHEKSLLEDQAFVLDQIFEIMKAAAAKGEPYAALVVSGDIYDRAMPPSEAVTLLNSFLVRLSAELPGTHIFMNAGNHDSAARLAYAAEILELHNIHIATNTKKITEPVILEDAASGDKGARTAFYQLPFLTPLSVESADGEPCRSQQQLYEAACARIMTKHRETYGSMPCVLNAHLFASGSSVAASERTNVGTAEQVDVSVFKEFTYGAFGHIHKYQPCDKEKRCYYPGSLLAYNFDDNPENGMLEVEITAGTGAVSVTRIPLRPLHSIAKVTAEMQELIGAQADKALIKAHQDDYVQVILTDRVMPTEAFATLKPVFPHLLSVLSQQLSHGQTNASIQERRDAIISNDPEKIFNQFMKDVYGERSDAELQADDLFQEQKKLFVEEAGRAEVNA